MNPKNITCSKSTTQILKKDAKYIFIDSEQVMLTVKC